jgi:predicted metal-dependent phosphoesterase TrpH
MKKQVTFNFHIHTTYSSDGHNSIAKIYQHAQQNKIDVLAITDHDTIEGAIAFLKWLKTKNKTGLQIIVGEEVTCSDGTHIIGLFLKNKIQSSNPVDVVKEIKAQGAFVYFPHPERKDGILKSIHFEETLPFGDFYEHFNAKISNEYNDAAVEKLSNYEHLKPLGGSDAHYNYDIRKCVCTMDQQGNLFETLLAYKASGAIKIEGVKRWGSNLYMPGYNKYKERLNLPVFIKEAGKKVYPQYKNYKDKKQKLVFETILNTLKS